MGRQRGLSARTADNVRTSGKDQTQAALEAFGFSELFRRSERTSPGKERSIVRTMQISALYFGGQGRAITLVKTCAQSLGTKQNYSVKKSKQYRVING